MYLANFGRVHTFDSTINRLSDSVGCTRGEVFLDVRDVVACSAASVAFAANLAGEESNLKAGEIEVAKWSGGVSKLHINAPCGGELNPQLPRRVQPCASGGSRGLPEQSVEIRLACSREAGST